MKAFPVYITAWPCGGRLQRPAVFDPPRGEAENPPPHRFDPLPRRPDGNRSGNLPDADDTARSEAFAGFDPRRFRHRPDRGFRVEIFTSRLYGEANREQAIAQKFPLPIHLDYEVPYYRLRVGDFATGGAEQMSRESASVGYSTAWVARAIKKAYQPPPPYPGSADFAAHTTRTTRPIATPVFRSMKGRREPGYHLQPAAPDVKLSRRVAALARLAGRDSDRNQYGWRSGRFREAPR